MRANCQRHVRRFIGLFVACILSTFCAGVNRESRVTISADGEIAYPGIQTHGCGDQLFQKDEQFGGVGKVRYEHQKGFIVEGEAGAAHGHVIETNVGSATGRDYLIEFVGARIGYDWKYFGLDAGAMGVFNNIGRGMGVPRLNLRFGLLDKLWGEIGTDVAGDRLAGGTPLGGGLAFNTSIISGHASVGLMFRPITDFGVTYQLYAARWGSIDEIGDVSGYLQATFHVGAGFGINVGGILGKTYSATAGISYSF